MKLNIGHVYTIKLNSGEELVAKVESVIDEKYFTVQEPLSVAPNHQGMGLIPSLFTSGPGQSVTINTNSVSMYAEADESIKNKYLEVTTGIKVPDKKIILG
jgi:hypothetical protein